MGLDDSTELRVVLSNLFPTLIIEDVVPTPSSQRIVYFCSFSDCSASEEFERFQGWHEWGKVVLKVSAAVHPSVIARLEKEIEILNSLDTQYFPKHHYYDVFSEDPVTEEKFPNRLFITIEDRIDGKSLNDCREQFIDEISVLNLLLQLVDGLRFLWEHKQKIVHRDLKPDNIIICSDGRPVIIDLGIIREEGSVGLTNTHQQWGPCSAPYASPEQAKNDKLNINFRSDFFALGIIAYELLTASNPFWRNETDICEDVIQRVIDHIPDDLYTLKKTSKEFSDFVVCLMAKEPYQRFRTVKILRDSLIKIIKAKS